MGEVPLAWYAYFVLIITRVGKKAMLDDWLKHHHGSEETLLVPSAPVEANECGTFWAVMSRVNVPRKMREDIFSSLGKKNEKSWSMWEQAG